jgi:hypothetical protein
MKSLFFLLMLLMPAFLSAQYSFTAKDGTVLENNSKQSFSAGTSVLQFQTLTEYGFKTEKVHYGFGGAIDYVSVSEITFSDLLTCINAKYPEIKEYKNHYFYLGGGYGGTGNLVYNTTYWKDQETGIRKESSMEVFVNGGLQAAKDYLEMLIAKAKEVTSQPGYTDDRSSFGAFNKLEQAENDKKVDDFIGGLDLDLTTDEEKAAKIAKEEERKAQQIASYTPIFFKKSDGEIAYSIYYVDDKYSSLKTYVYQGDKEKLLFKTFNTIFAGGSRMPKSADFTNCNWCSIYSIVGDGNKVLLKDKPNAIKYEIIYKDNEYNLVKGSGTLTEQDYDSKLKTLCYLSSDGNNIYVKGKRFDIEGYKLHPKQLMFVLSMIFMAGYEENEIMN